MSTTRKVILVIFSISIIAAILSVYIIYSRSQEPLAELDKLAVHIILPNENPTIATVTDSSLLETEFLKSAQKDDKIFFYEKWQRVIIYRPSADKIVDIGPISIAPASGQ